MHKTKKDTVPKFIPNIKQLQEAIKQLPDPEEWNENSYYSAITVDEKEVAVSFARKKIQRGSKTTYRWIYENKVLIRNRDANKHNDVD